jgi:hypothetical protein
MLCLAGCFLFAFTTLAKEDLTTLQGLQGAFRRAHDSGSIRRLESLVCWDRTTPQQRHEMREALQDGLEDRIHRMEIVPFPAEHPLGPLPNTLHDPNLKPTHLLLVWYDLGVFRGTRYPVGKKNGRYYFVVGNGWNSRIRSPVILWSQPKV